MTTSISSGWGAQLTLALAMVTSAAGAQSVADGTYTVKALHSGQCLDVIDSSSATGGNVVQWTCDDRKSQQWSVVHTGDGYYQLQAAHSGKALDVSGAGVANGVNVQQWDVNNTQAQRFAVTPVGTGIYSLINRNSGKAVDVSGISQDVGANVHQWTYVGGDNQKWRFTKAGQPPVTGAVVPLYTASTPRLGELTEVRADGTRITRFGGRVRDRHARESQFQAYQHWLPNYFVHRTFTMEIVDTTRAGGNTITFNMTTNYPHLNDDMRLFFLGNNTVAEYYANVGLPRVDPYHYTRTFTFNEVHKREIRAGDLMEFEVGIFLEQPVEGRFNYYSNAWLYRAGDAGLLPWEGTGARRDSVPLPDTRLLGGGTTDSINESNEPESAFMQMATNIAPVHTQPFTEGRRVHHTSFLDGSHTEPGNPALLGLANKAGPLFNESACVNCHTNNGRSTPPTTSGTAIDRMVFKVGETNGAGNFVAHSRFGSQLQTRAVSGAAPEATVSILRFDTTSGRFSDGSSYELSKPVYQFSGATIPYYSALTALPLVGLGLLEAIDEQSILALADPNDSNRDGISGRISSVTDPETKQTRLGRFGWKADRATIRHQVGAALSEDIGVSNPVFKGASNSVELSESDLVLLTDYLRVLAVPPQRVGNPANVARGDALFAQAGCESCHTESLRTGRFHPFAELRNQEIRPYSDLLLHDMGEGLASTLPGASASAREWRTAPLWGIGLSDDVAGQSARYLHDGRARSVLEAILWHGGEAENAKQRVVALNAADRAALLAYLDSL